MLYAQNDYNYVMCNYMSSMPIEEQEWRDVNPVDYVCFSSYIPQTESLLYTVFENTFTLADDQQ